MNVKHDKYIFLIIAKEIILQHSPRAEPGCYCNKSTETFQGYAIMSGKSSRKTESCIENIILLISACQGNSFLENANEPFLIKATEVTGMQGQVATTMSLIRDCHT